MPKTACRQAYSADPRELPNYGITEASRYLGIPVATLRSWTLGRRYPTADGERTWPALIDLPDKMVRELSFMNLVSRLRAGDSIAELRDDYGLAEEQVEEAIRYELLAA